MASESSGKHQFKVEHLFGSKTRARLIALFAHNSETKFYVRELARRIDSQLNSVRRELQNLLDLGVIKEFDVKADGQNDKRKFYAADKEFTLFSDLRSLMKKIQLMLKKNLVHQIDAQGKIDLLILTGKFVDNAAIPVDLLAVGDVSEATVQKMLQAFEKEFGQEVNFAVMTRDEYIYRKQVSDRFLYSILNTEHVVMIDRLKSKPKGV